ncbi:ABC transporter ATP-binding protein [Oribacterium sp. oral taxon 102]|uniref:ABC transporter ATP-binding protein n=1 Tax=Oribacterium sp. oral taxon 102 TaxID=671214 RepID=UPI0015BD1F8B|nr:ABC transporter ATP-binding protein [Oribacterium sp. oral taxon 102]NWO21768.1 ABC transporter ATP-binding protein [Oribacterium sp. oral taxon 102]
MISIQRVEKSFDDFKAVNAVSLDIAERQVFGLIGTNGAGKSTLLRMLCGVLTPDGGEIYIDEGKVYDNPLVKRNIFFISDEPFFFRNGNAEDMKNYYRSIYEDFDAARFDTLLSDFGLEKSRRISNFSKGMRKQLSVILGICSRTKYLVCDETFDGLDPVMRQAVKSIFANDMVERGLTPIIASHNLRELEDICDHIGLLHQGGVVLSEDLDSMKLGLQKVQAVFRGEEEIAALRERLSILSENRVGKLCTFTVRNNRRAVEEVFRGLDTVFYEILPLTLEEIFISETEGVGYDVRKFILN